MKREDKVCGDVPSEPVWWVIVPRAGLNSGVTMQFRAQTKTAFEAAAKHGFQLHQVVIHREEA